MPEPLWTFCEAGCGKHFRFNAGQRFCQNRDCQSARFRVALMGNTSAAERAQVDVSLRRSELARLVEEQEYVMAAGQRQPRQRAMSLDAPLAHSDRMYGNALSLYDLIPAEDEA